MISAHEFYLKNIGKGTDIDGAAGVQCVDLWKLFLKELNVPNPTKPIGGSGYAKEIFLRRKELGYMDYFVDVHVSAMHDGDWAIWENCTACPDTHVAMFRKDNGNGTGIFLGQNQGGKRETTQINIPYAGIIGVLRAKAYVAPVTPPTPAPKPTPVVPSAPAEGLKVIKENGTFTLTVDKINFRSKPTTTVPVEGYYVKGQSVNYDSYVRNEDKVWIHWVSASKGVDRWMACRVVSTNEPWGTFK